MNQNGEIRVLYVQPGKYPEEIKIPNTLETFQKYVCGSIESVRLDRDAYIICNGFLRRSVSDMRRRWRRSDKFDG